MAYSSEKNIFHEFLMEEYKKKPKVIDVVAIKRQNFQKLLFKAHCELNSKDFSEAKQSYLDIIQFLKNDPYPDELQLSPDEYYCIKCGFCYSCLMDVSHDEEKFMKHTAEVLKTLSEEYSHMLFPKFLQVLLHFHKKNWEMTLYWCNAIEKHENMSENCCTVDTEAVLPKTSQIKTETEKYEEKSFFNYWKMLAKTRLEKSKNGIYGFLAKEIDIIEKLTNLDCPFSKSDLQDIFHQDVIPLWNTTDKGKFYYHSEEKAHSHCDDLMTAKIKSCVIVENTQGAKINFEKYIGKLIGLFTKIYECTFIESVEDPLFNKIEEVEELLASKTPLKKKSLAIKDQTSIGQIQTEKIKTEAKSMQTERIKSKSVEVQVNIDIQLLNILEIKNNLLVSQQKKDDTIAKLTRRVSELVDKVTKETNKRKSTEEQYQKKIAKQEFEMKKLREQLDACEKKRKEENDKNNALQKFLVEQISDKFNMHKNIYRMFEKKSEFMVMYLREMNQFLTSTSIPSEAVVHENINIWESHVKRIKEDLNNLNTFYKKVRGEMINSNKFNMTWPEIPEFPRDEDNIVFISFKPAIKNIIDIEEKILKQYKAPIPGPVQPLPQMTQNIPYTVPRPPFPIHTSSYFMGPRLVYPQSYPLPTNNLQQYQNFTRERAQFEIHMQPQQSHVEQKTPQNKNLKPSKSTEYLNKCVDKEMKVVTENGASHSQKEDKKYQEKEKMIIEYVIDNCPGVSEEDVTLALLHVVDENKGTLSKLSKEKIVEDVRMVLRMKKQLAWVTPKSPHVEWENDHSERNCTICFEEFSLSDSYTLPCQHEYHKECIKKWLKTSSVCPICRIHSVIDEDFPALH